VIITERRDARLFECIPTQRHTSFACRRPTVPAVQHHLQSVQGLPRKDQSRRKQGNGKLLIGMEGGGIPPGGTFDSITSDTDALGATILQQTTGAIPTNGGIEPFWGSPTSFSDCLEANYAYSPYIAEFYSVLTCIPWLILPLYGMALSSSSTSSSLPSPSSGREGKKGAGRQTVFWCHVLQLSAGISGVIFHTTLSFYAELLDRTTVIGWLLCVLFILRSFNCGRGGRGQARGGGVLKVGSLYSLIPARFSPFKPPREYASGRSGGGDVQNQPRREGEPLIGAGKRKERLWPYLLAAIGAEVFACFDLHAFYYIGLVAIILYSVRPVLREHKEFKHLWDIALLFAAFAIASYLLDLVPPSSPSSSTSTSTSSAFSFFFFSSFFDSMMSVFYSFFPYSHSLWHLLALYSTWVVTLFLLMVELERKGNYRMEVQYVRGIYPYTVSPRRFSPSSALFIDVADF